MRFLCLHGAGTNTRIFELQTVGIRYELDGDHTFDFVEGTVACPVFPGMDSLASPEDEFFAYYQPHSKSSFRKAVKDLENFIVAEGPFDGVIAFSQASSLIAALLVENAANKGTPKPQPFRCAIIFSGRSPYIDAGLEGSSAARPDDEAVIKIPTAHIWGAKDDLEPGQPEALVEWCSPENRYTFVHRGGHEIPGSADQEGIVGSVQVIRRALERMDS